MASSEGRTLTRDDLDRAVRAVAGLLKTDQVIVVGSQALLVVRDDIDRSLRASEEIDIYPANAKAWEQANPGLEASEQINGILGEGSAFHQTFGFYVDGVDERTATLPADWKLRQVTREILDDRGKPIIAIAPSPTDIVAAKLHRGDPKDREFASRCIRLGMVKHDAVLASIQKIAATGGVMEQAVRLLRDAARHKNDYVTARGPTRSDPIEVMLQELKSLKSPKSK